ncbi:choline dehydrogenase [Pseudomonas plecoglossicida]|uniref:choline dehydrogenase n=1 Tax=Pseudomonas plecoglossicida TaxID=70775 RepID=UPI003977B747
MGIVSKALQQYDYVVVGGGSAGCVIASRLSEESSVSVLLIEAGPTNQSWTIDMPLAVERLLVDDKYNWAYESERDASINDRQIAHPRGRVLGGSSSINGMVYTRGHALDYENWEQKYGCKGWGYAGVLPYFKKAETSLGNKNDYRGTKGPLFVNCPDVMANPINKAFMLAGAQAGYPVTKDSNAFQQEGFGPNECTIYKGERWSTARAYLSSTVMKRKNLHVITGALAEKIIITDKTAKGVIYRHQGNRLQVLASREVIISGGAFNSPQLLQLSGIGPRDVLEKANVPVVHELPGVGANLQDHPDLVIKWQCKTAAGLGTILKFPKKHLTGISWFLNRSGAASSNQFEAAAYLRSRPGLKYPNFKLEMLPLAFQNDTFTPYQGFSFQIHMTLMRADSRGYLKITSADPSVKPDIKFNYLQEESDLVSLREALKLTRELVSQEAFDELRGEELEPGIDCQTDEQLDRWIRKVVATAYHPSCTCRMGTKDDPMAVVTPDLRIRGIANLRVADASVMPEVIASNTNAPTIMIGEKAADLIKGKSLLDEQKNYFVSPEWQSSQK